MNPQKKLCHIREFTKEYIKGCYSENNWEKGNTLRLFNAVYMPQGSLSIIGVRDSHESTNFALNIIAEHCVAGNKAIAFFSLQNGYEEVINGLISLVGKGPMVDYHNEKHKDCIQSTIKTIEKAPFYLDNSPRISAEEINERIITLSGLKLIIIDSMELLHHSNNLKGFEEVAFKLKQIAEKHNISIILFCKLPFGGSDDERPHKEDFRRYGNLDPHADIMGYLYNTNNSKSSLTEKYCLSICKNNYGDNQNILLDFNPESITFSIREAKI